jgi:hypothetical protein
MTRTGSTLVAACAALGLATGCSGTPSTGIVAPPAPSNVITETFSTLLVKNGSQVFPFNSTAAGGVSVVISTISPDSALSLGIDLGTFNGTSCTIQFSTNPAVQGASVSAQANAAGALCARVYDPLGVIVNPEAIIVTVSHF